jgi:hypothetical protein
MEGKRWMELIQDHGEWQALLLVMANLWVLLAVSYL